MAGPLWLYALLLMFFAGTEQACLLRCSCQLDGVADCRDLGLTSLYAEEATVDVTIQTILASDNSLQHVNISMLLKEYPYLKLLVLTSNADLVCPDFQSEVTVVGCQYSTSEVTVGTTTATTTTTTTVKRTSTFPPSTTMTKFNKSNGAVLEYNKESDTSNVSRSVAENSTDPAWKTAVYAAVGSVAFGVFAAAVIGGVCYLRRKARQNPSLEFYSHRSLYNQSSVYVSTIDETSSENSE